MKTVVRILCVDNGDTDVHHKLLQHLSHLFSPLTFIPGTQPLSISSPLPVNAPGCKRLFINCMWPLFVHRQFPLQTFRMHHLFFFFAAVRIRTLHSRSHSENQLYRNRIIFFRRNIFRKTATQHFALSPVSASAVQLSSPGVEYNAEMFRFFIPKLTVHFMKQKFKPYCTKNI